MTGQSAPLLLTAGEGPWLWRVVRYGLLAGALDNHKTVFSQAAVSQLRGLGSVISTAEGEWPRAEYSNAAQTFTFSDGEDLTLELARFDDAGETTALHSTTLESGGTVSPLSGRRRWPPNLARSDCFGTLHEKRRRELPCKPTCGCASPASPARGTVQTHLRSVHPRRPPSHNSRGSRTRVV